MYTYTFQILCIEIMLPAQQKVWGGLPWVKRTGRKADHSPLSNAEVMNAWSCTSTSAHVSK